MSEQVDEAELARIEGLVRSARERLVACEEASARLRSLLEAILRAVPPLVAVDEGLVVAWSAELEELSGVAAPSALGRRVAGLLGGAEEVVHGVRLVVRRDGALQVLEPGEVDLRSEAGGFAPARAPG